MSAQPTVEGLEEIRALAAEFAAERLRPYVERWDRECAIDAAARAGLRELGFTGMLVPESHGGLGFGLPVWVAALEELAWGEPAVALCLTTRAAVATALLELGSEALKQRWLEPLASGGAAAWHGLSSRTGVRATGVGSGWRLDGTVGWVLRDGAHGLALLPARSGEAAATDSWFILPTDADGLRAAARLTTLGLRSAEFITLALEDAHIGEDALLGRGEALEAAAPRIACVERLGLAAIATGIARAALEHATQYAAEREQFGQKLRAFEGIQFKLADMATRVAAARALVQTAAASPDARSVAIARLFASEAAMWVSTQAVQIFGGYGYMRDYPVEKLMRDAKATEILATTNEDLRVLIAAELYRA
jgi:hypothetical protein